ncbi:proteasome lid subunit RPN8/RPN11 [Rhodobium orientis]|uniref:JAB domain-containing protein n=1 Tax=Rhodobium orientis TaxID=34017 RepID=A0A327JMF8_9HYPH|nr:Mov34/MPN/PAD-1 family protein [Rhodobium orientis]MBB4305691.1 proteasome lid subunit RPN8/RPN11 [Rhodobium orientis]MBK5948418.1 hypothetical protein [Rhodobium orientis]RAI24608.1 hypothetical protein CH339_21955 [Rhodobium orientis]
MNLPTWLGRWFKSTPTPHTDPRRPKIIMPQDCLLALTEALRPSLERRHEGIAYLLGRTDGTVTLATTVFAPVARTTAGSFHVDARSMAICMQAAGAHELQIVAQVHTHPGQAYHSDGDVDGARIRYPGYASIVVPNYGVHLPQLDGIAAYLWRAGDGWQTLNTDDLIIIPGAGPWTRTNG